MLVLLVIIVIVLRVILWFTTYDNDYWKNRNVAYIRPKPFFGNFTRSALLRISTAEIYRNFYESVELKDEPYGGIFLRNRPALLLRDPDIIKNVLVKDFHHFSDRGIPFHEEKPLQAHLFNLSGWRWQYLRTKLSPTFSPSKMKMKFNLLLKCAEEMKTKLKLSADKEDIVEIRNELANFTTDVIGSYAFSLQLNSINDQQNRIRTIGRQIFEFTFKNTVVRFLRGYAPYLLKFIKISNMSAESTEYFVKLIMETVKYRQENNLKINDLTQLLADIRSNKLELSQEVINNMQQKLVDEKNGAFELTDNILTSQAFVFFTAGFEISSTTMGFALHELALNPEIQDKLGGEIQQVLNQHEGKFTYDAIQEIKYLDQVIAESLRKFSPAAHIMRRCTKSYTIEATNLNIEKNTLVFIPIYGLHYDSKYYPQPEVFNPDRFAQEERSKIHPYTYLPFGEGPRTCIGMRFGLLQAKLGLATLLHEYKFEICEKSTFPTQLDPRGLVAALKGGVWLRIKNR